MTDLRDTASLRTDWHTESRRRTVRGDGVDLAVLEIGDPEAVPVVLVHGWPDTHRTWLPVARILARGLRVVLYDTRGTGLSPTRAPDSRFALPHLANDLMAVLDDASAARPAHVVGHDWGSVQGWEAVCQPGADERIASFTSISGPNLDHVASWARRTIRHPSAPGIAGRPDCATTAATWPRACADPASGVRPCRCCSSR